LQDIVNADYSAIRFHAPFKDFHESPLPSDLDAYLSYRHMAMQFIAARNQRIRAWMPPAADARVPE
jgi:hypothetical protein